MSTRYVFVVRGRIPESWTAEFDHLDIRPQADGTTAIEGPVTDQSCLFGHLHRIESLGLTLVSVNPAGGAA